MSVSAASKFSERPSPVVDALAHALANTMVATAKAQTYHWNVTGMAFGPLHALFQEIYEDHFAAQDEISERIKALGSHADGRLSVALKSGAVSECDGRLGAEEMVRRLAGDQRTLSSTLHAAARIADDASDFVSHDLAVERAHAHDKFAWMLESHLAG